jgi:hypothetical protein
MSASPGLVSPLRVWCGESTAMLYSTAHPGQQIADEVHIGAVVLFQAMRFDERV